MTKEEIKTRLEQIEKELFMIDMIDRWNEKDSREHRNLINEKYYLLDLLKKM